MNAALCKEVADALWTAETNRMPIPPVTETWPALSVEDAYRVQVLNVERRIAAGRVIRGHKVGLTSAAMREAFGVDEPDYGHLIDDMLIDDGAELRVDRYCSARVEPELAFVLGTALSGPSCTVVDVLAATSFVVPAFELIDSRIVDWRISLADTIADNASSAGVILGGSATVPRDRDLRSAGVVVRRNGEIVETGAVGAVLGNPATAVQWLVNKLHSLGTRLEAGHVVLPGSCTAPIEVRAGDSVRADFEDLGSVTVSWI